MRVISPGEDGRPRRGDDLAASLRGLKLSELQARASLARSIDAQRIVEAMDADKPKQVRKTPSWPRSWANFSLF